MTIVPAVPKCGEQTSKQRRQAFLAAAQRKGQQARLELLGSMSGLLCRTAEVDRDTFAALYDLLPQEDQRYIAERVSDLTRH